MFYKKTIQSLAIAFGLAGLAASASATTFDYSYMFRDGQSINGTFTGTVDAGNSNLIDNIGSVTGKITGTGANTGYIFDSLLPGKCDYPCSVSTISTSGAVVSLDGLQSNFFFVNNLNDDATTNWFYVIPNGSGGSLDQARLMGNKYLDFDNRGYNAANFSITAEPTIDPGTPGNVPEPASIALLALGMLGFAASRRKSTK